MCHYSSEDFAGYLRAHRDRYITAWFECEERSTEENYRALCNVMGNFLFFSMYNY